MSLPHSSPSPAGMNAPGSQLQWVVTSLGNLINIQQVVSISVAANVISVVYPATTTTLTYATDDAANFDYKMLQKRLIQLDLRGKQGITATSVSPTTGPAAGGTSVMLYGTGFDSSTTLTIGDNSAIVTLLDVDIVLFVTPAHAAGVVGVTVTNGDSTTATLAASYTYV